MSKTDYNTPLPAADRSAPYSVQLTPVITRVVAFLRSRAKTVLLPLDADSPKSPLEFAEKQANSTFTRAQVRTLAGKVIMQMKNNGPVSVKDRIPTYATGPKATAANIAKVLELTYTVNEGKDKERTTLAALHVLAQTRRNYARKVKADRLAAKVASGDAFFANNEAVVAHVSAGEDDEKELADLRERVTKVLVSKDGTPRAFASMKKAAKAVARCIFGANWFDVDKKVKRARLDECEDFCYEQSASVGQPDQHAVTGFFTVAVLEATHHATVRRLAREAGAPASATKSKALAIQWLSDDVSRMAGLRL